MNSQGVLSNSIDELQPRPCINPMHGSTAKKYSLDRLSAPVGSRFLPGLRPIENEVDAYFKEAFLWPGF